VTEKLSEMVARPYLRTPRAVIIQTTTLARRKRHEFVRAVSKGLIPPETPPTLRKVRKRRFPALMALDPVDDVSIIIACPIIVSTNTFPSVMNFVQGLSRK
jgi:ankyrin repeat/IBR domain-containing protein 1